MVERTQHGGSKDMSMGQGSARARLKKRGQSGLASVWDGTKQGFKGLARYGKGMAGLVKTSIVQRCLMMAPMVDRMQQNGSESQVNGVGVALRTVCER